MRTAVHVERVGRKARKPKKKKSQGRWDRTHSDALVFSSSSCEEVNRKGEAAQCVLKNPHQCAAQSVMSVFASLFFFCRLINVVDVHSHWLPTASLFPSS
jgi:hypothetical protein